MCGIIGCIGKEDVLPVLLQGLKQLEYRGYDSSGISVLNKKKIKVVKKAGKLEVLERSVHDVTPSPLGIGHTRWATHGVVNDINSHPHVSFDNKVALVHNGIIDNFSELKNELLKEGLPFQSETDTEVIAHLIAWYLKKDPEVALKKALNRLEGTYGIVVMFADYPDRLYGAKKGSPLVVGVGENSMYIASDASAFIASTQRVIYLEDNEVVLLQKGSYKTTNMQNLEIPKDIEALDWKKDAIQKGDFDHFLIKEIYEQPDVIRRAFGEGGRFIQDYGTVKLGGLNIDTKDLIKIKRIEITGMGTALYSGLVGAYLFESLARIPTKVTDASEMIYANPIIQNNALYFAVSQSGETADTITAVREIQNKGGRVLGIINSPGSTISRMCEGGVYIHAGPEVSVAATKTFTSQITVFSLLAILFGRMRDISLSEGKNYIKELQAIPEKVKEILKHSDAIREVAHKYAHCANFIYVSRGINYPIALEGALKLKEINYTFAEGYSAGNLKHGPLALISEEIPTLFIVVKGNTYDKILSNMQEIRARNGKIIAVTNVQDEKINSIADDVILFPPTIELFSPLLSIIPLQLFAYYVAKKCGREIDQPRNLAKCVTVE